MEIKEDRSIYNFKKIEDYSKKKWEDNDFFEIDLNDKSKQKKYFLDMFPYPSSNGLHVGHIRGYLATDIFARYYLLKGYNVFKPIGWDAFGLPAEQYAIKHHKPPKDFVLKNISNFRNQIKRVGFYFNYKYEINTADPAYYKTTQLIFLRLFKKKLAFKKSIPVNWCEKLKTVLANEEVINCNGKLLSERGSYPVIKKDIMQWVLKITSDARRLQDNLDNLEWPKDIIKLQKNWIKLTNGFLIKGTISKQSFDIFFESKYLKTFNPLFLAITKNSEIYKYLIKNYDPEKLLVDEVLKYEQENQNNIENWDYFDVIKILDHKINFNSYSKSLPILLVTKLNSNLNIDEEIIFGKDIKENKVIFEYINNNKKLFTSIWNELNNQKEENDISSDQNLLKYKLIKSHKTHLKDWVFSRQRYWGEPFPIILDNNDPHPMKETDLPLVLPETNDFDKVYNFFPPLKFFKNWQEVKSKTNQLSFREIHVMPQWAGSCWYYIGYLLKAKDNYLSLESKEAKNILNYWLPVDLYIGGKEHAVLHLLYARFWHHFLFDEKIVSCQEPFKMLYNQGLILNDKGEKMSKSANNYVSPDEIIDNYGADALRVYEMFIGPINLNSKWLPHGVFASNKWLKRVYRFFTELIKVTKTPSPEFEQTWNKTIKLVPKDIEAFKFNTSISKFMVFINYLYKNPEINLEYTKAFLQIFSTFCPFLSEYLWDKFNLTPESIYKSKLSEHLK
ncbi:class I tRNA ligase family protein [Mycoplasma sp. SG1]|uniref:class I tRNA ligase family protein n=1 Tax=Mycoplasma sp. SG1 TaxID=2810348 RepID=UPI0020250F56|nr:class I tRNA ligase family protein [Mycoplasma sp. SG1]URM52793.1 class I tRNA ligase family protein [Mycoplasma sp. SG1]